MPDRSLLRTADVPDAESVNAEMDSSARLANACRPHPAPTGAELERLRREIMAQSLEWSSRAPDVTEEELTDMIDEAIRGVRSQSR